MAGTRTDLGSEEVSPVHTPLLISCVALALWGC